MKFLIGLVRFLIIIAVIGLITFHGGQFYVAQQMQRALAGSFGTPVNIAKTQVDLMNKSVTLYDVTVENVEGFTAPVAFEAPKVVMSLGKVTHKVIEATEISIEKPRLHYQIRADDASNLAVIDSGLRKQLRPADAPLSTTGIIRLGKVMISGAILVVYEPDGKVRILPVDTFETDFTKAKTPLPAMGLQEATNMTVLTVLGGVGERTLPSLKVEQMIESTKEMATKAKDKVKEIGQKVEGTVKGFFDSAKTIYNDVTGAPEAPAPATSTTENATTPAQ